MAYQALIGRHFRNENPSTLYFYLSENNLILEEANGESFVRKETDPAGYKRYAILRKDYAEISEVYIGKVADPVEDNLDAILQGVTEDLPEAVIHYW